MKFYSYVSHNSLSLHSVEVQIQLSRGLPDIKFSGLADSAIKEITIRLKSAFKNSGFSWPDKKQIVVHLSPAYIKKQSLGLDLAISAALLWKSGQIDLSYLPSNEIYFYGEIGLDGNVIKPKDSSAMPFDNQFLCLGRSKSNENYRKNLYLIENLKDLHKLHKAEVLNWKKHLKPPTLPDIYFSKEAANILQIISLGEHHSLFCGKSGSGKTILSETIHYLLSPPSEKDWKELQMLNKRNGGMRWRPSINPHHSIPIVSMIGGGSPLFLGEISKAHKGQLIMDEYLEFNPKIQEALREPLEKRHIQLSRRGIYDSFPSDFILNATSNLCPCGDYVPNYPISCNYSLRKCQSYKERLSGPMLDRFDILAFSNQWKGDRSIFLKKIFDSNQEIRHFISKTREQKIPNGKLDLKDLENSISPKMLKLLPETSSYRRKRALLRIARTIADINKREEVDSLDIEKSFFYSVKNFHLLKN